MRHRPTFHRIWKYLNCARAGRRFLVPRAFQRLVLNGQSRVTPERHQAIVEDGFIDGQRIEIGVKGFSLAPPRARAKGAMFFSTKPDIDFPHG
jgi:hypothetical protein